MKGGEIKMNNLMFQTIEPKKHERANQNSSNNRGTQNDFDFEKVLQYNKGLKNGSQSELKTKQSIKSIGDQKKPDSIDNKELIGDVHENSNNEEINNMIQLIQLILNNQDGDAYLEDLDLHSEGENPLDVLKNQLQYLTDGKPYIEPLQLNDSIQKSLALTSILGQVGNEKVLTNEIKEVIRKLQQSSNVNEELVLDDDNNQVEIAFKGSKHEANDYKHESVNTKISTISKSDVPMKKPMESTENGIREEKLTSKVEPEETEVIKLTSLNTKGDVIYHTNLFSNDIENSDHKQLDVNIIEGKTSFLDHSKDINQKIIEQVVEKASLQVNEKDSEIHLQLKPDNLGKLTMRIAVEKGIVIAQIVAENQAVKEILESNFNYLRDALNQKGFGIQEFSVNVGQDPNANARNAFKNFNKRNKNRMDLSETSYNTSIMNNEYSTNRLGTSSSIDFLA